MVCMQHWVLPTLLSPETLQQGKVNQHTRDIAIWDLRFQNNEDLALVMSLASPSPLLQPIPVTSLPSSTSRSWGETACSHSVPAGGRVESWRWVSVPLSILLSNGQSWAELQSWRGWETVLGWGSPCGISVWKTSMQMHSHLGGESPQQNWIG